jgi:hypothetical protein
MFKQIIKIIYFSYALFFLARALLIVAYAVKFSTLTISPLSLLIAYFRSFEPLLNIFFVILLIWSIKIVKQHSYSIFLFDN